MANNYSFFDSLKLKGMFWVPENPTDKMVGELTYEPGDNIRLDLFGSFEPMDRKRQPIESINPKIVHGIAATGELITLYKVYSSGSTVSFPGYNRSNYSAIYLFIGAHIKDPNKNVFSNISLSTSRLDEWFMSRPFKETETKKSGQNGMSVRFKAPKNLKWRLNARQCTMESDYSFKSGGESWCSIRWGFVPFLKITADEQKDFHWFFEIGHTTLNLVSLLVGQSVSPQFFQLRYVDGEKATAIDALWVNRGMESKSNATNSIHPLYLLAPYPLIRKNTKSILNAFYNSEMKFTAVYNTFFSQLSNQDGYVETKFLAVIQALEQYHRFKDKRQYLSNKKFDAVEACLMEALPPQLPTDFIDAMRGRIHYGNELSLRSRLKLLLQELDTELREAFFPDLKKFIKRVVDERNALTHGSLKEAQRATANDLHYATKQLEVLLLVQLLREAKIPEKVYQKGISHRFRWLKEYVHAKPAIP